MKEHWSYDKAKRMSKNKTRYHFVMCNYLDENISYDDTPYELYFRNDKNTEYGLLRFEKKKDNPYKNYEVVINKIMNNDDFRKSLIDNETASIWLKNWK
jgi:hypothetical protein